MDHALGFSVHVLTAPGKDRTSIQVEPVALASTNAGQDVETHKPVVRYLRTYTVTPEQDRAFYTAMEQLDRLAPTSMLGPLCRLIEISIRLGIQYERERTDK